MMSTFLENQNCYNLGPRHRLPVRHVLNRIVRNGQGATPSLILFLSDHYFRAFLKRGTGNRERGTGNGESLKSLFDYLGLSVSSLEPRYFGID